MQFFDDEFEIISKNWCKMAMNGMVNGWFICHHILVNNSWIIRFILSTIIFCVDCCCCYCYRWWWWWWWCYCRLNIKSRNAIIPVATFFSLLLIAHNILFFFFYFYFFFFFIFPFTSWIGAFKWNMYIVLCLYIAEILLKASIQAIYFFFSVWCSVHCFGAGPLTLCENCDFKVAN